MSGFLGRLRTTALRFAAPALVGAVAGATAVAGTVLGTSASDATPQGYAPGPRCAWQLMSNSQRLNVAFPDANATYWTLPYVLGTGDTITLSGTYPAARYFSLNTYGTDFNTVDTLRDAQIRPAAGPNPFTDPSAESAMGHGRWRATVVNRAPDRARNEMRGLPAGGRQSTPIGFLIIRVYVPNAPGSVSGGVPLPTVTMRTAGSTITLPPCASTFNPAAYTGPVATAMKSLFDRVIAQAAAGAFPTGAPEATFINPASTSGLFPNGDNKYVGTSLTYRPGRVAVVRGRAPTFPNTRAGASPAQPGKQVRYWTMCQNDKVSPYPVVDCASDFQTRLDGQGYYTYVVAAPAEAARLRHRPGLTLLGWGSTAVPVKILFLRNMLPAPSFTESIQTAQAGSAPLAASMGEYYPRATYCDVDVLATRGYQACYR